MSLKSNIAEAVSYLREQHIEDCKVGIILGTGLGDLVKSIENARYVSYSSIPHFEKATVETHDGKLIIGELAGHKVICMQGRFHYYEGYDMKQVTFPIYVLRALGVNHLVVSNAAGNLHPEWNKGDLMIIEDHINLLPENPLRGTNDSSLGPRFPDLFQPYDAEQNDLIEKAGKSMDLVIRRGIYVAVPGPNLETRAEYKYLRTIGADAVGMSTVPEVIVANYLGMRVSAISVLTDDCDPQRLKPVSIQEILSIAGEAEKGLSAILKNIVSKLN